MANVEEDDALDVFWACVGGFLVLCLICFMIWASPAKASEIDKNLFVDSIIGEAEGEEYVGKLAVACAIRNRGTLDGVYGWRAPRVRLHAYSSRVFVQAVRAYEESAQPENCQFIDGATHWQSKEDRKKAGKWLRAYEVVNKIGGHWFYKHK